MRALRSEILCLCVLNIDPYPYEDYLSLLRTPESQETLLASDRESIVLLENRQNTLPLSKNIGSVALIGPHADRVSVSHKHNPVGYF